MCPVHIDDMLNGLHGASKVPGIGPPVTNRAYKVRRPKNPIIRDVSMSRGFVNNGLIEILNEPGFVEGDPIDRDEGGVIYRLPENGIKLDFLHRVKR